MLDNNKNNMNGLILEGISGSGKTTILKALLKSSAYTDRDALSTIIYTEHQTQRILEKKDKENRLTIDDHINLLWDITNTFKQLNLRLQQREWRGKSEQNAKISYILERFHLTHACHYPYITWNMIKPIDYNLSLLGCKICLFTVNEETLHKRLFERDNNCWMNYLKRYGNTKEEIVHRFISQQNQFISLCKRSALPSMIIDTSNQEAKSIIKQITEFWKIN